MSYKKIVAPLNKIVAKLEAYVQKCHDESMENEETIDTLTAANVELVKEQEQANTTADNIRKLVG